MRRQLHLLALLPSREMHVWVQGWKGASNPTPSRVSRLVPALLLTMFCVPLPRHPQVQRLTYRRRHCYRTTGNRVRVVKTPGGNLVYHHISKKGTTVKCGDCQSSLQGIPAARPKEFMRMSKRVKTVSRMYGGSRCASCVRDR
jgi:large subunit ribosomal protein L34e